MPPPIRLAKGHIPMECFSFLFYFSLCRQCSYMILKWHQSDTVPDPCTSSQSPSPLLSSCCLHALSLSAVVKAPPPLPAVMIMSARLLSCQTHRIYSGLFLMFTLMLLLFTRKGGKWLRFSAASYTHAGVSSCRLTA